MATGSWRGHLMRETVLHVLYRENICIPSYDYLWKGYSIKFCKQLEYLLENILRQYTVWNRFELPPFDLELKTRKGCISYFIYLFFNYLSLQELLLNVNI